MDDMDELMRMGISLWLRAACSRKGHRVWILRIAFCMSRAHPSFFSCHKRAFHIPLQSRRLYIASSRRLAEQGQSLVLATSLLNRNPYGFPINGSPVF